MTKSRDNQPSGQPLKQSPLLEAIRSGDEDAKREALQKMYSVLSAHAVAKLGRRERHAEMQATSVVQSVLVREIAAGDLDRFNDDQHLEARLKQAINNKIYDRNKKNRPVDLPADDDGAQFDPADEGPGVSTQVDRRHDLAKEAERMTRFREGCLAAPISETQRAILELVLFKEATWQDVAKQLGTTVSTAKARMSEARPKVIDHLLEPLRQECDGATWQIIETTIAQRRSIETAAKRAGVDEGAVKRILSEQVWPMLHELYGRESWEPLKRLMGYRKNRTSE